MAQVAVMERTATYTNLAPEARCLYDIYKKEGDVFYCRRKYKKALLSYNEALRLANHSAQTLVARSRCYMGIGMVAKALEDTEAALSISNTYLPAVYQKAQILYRQGNYEMALMMFNRGHKLSPSAPGFLEGVQKAQHAMDILNTGRNMKTTVVGDLSFYVPKKTASFHPSRRPLPGLGKSHDSSKTRSSEVRLPSPGFSKRHGMLLLNTQKRQPPVLSEASYGREGKRIGYLDDRAMREILGQLYDDKQYFERILNSNSGHRGDDLSGMLNSVLEDGLKFLYDRVLFWAQNGSLPPVAPHPEVVAKHYMQLQQQQQQGKVTVLDAETNSGEMSDVEESEEELIKVNQAIDAVSSVNDPESIANRKKKKLMIRKRRADILRKRASMVIVTRKKPKKSLPRDSKESLEEETEQMTPSRIQFHFSSLLPATGREERPKQQKGKTHTRRSLPEGSKISWEDDSATESGLVAVDDREEERQKQRAARRLRKQQQREAERKKQEEEAAKLAEDDEPREDPLAEYLDKVMNTMEDLYQRGDLKALKLKAESFLLTMERYDPSIVGTKMAFVGRAHSYLGNAHLGLRHFDFALMHHEKDLEIGQRWKILECQSRALGNIGRTHISTKKYSTALKYLAQKSKMVSEPKETAWLYHEIAGCFLQLHHYRFAHDAASKALAAAEEANDSLYLMQASVLQGAIQVKLQYFEKAYGSFEKAMDHAKLRDDKRAQQAITEALAELNEKMAKQAKEEQDQETSVIAAAAAGLMGQKQTDQEQEQGQEQPAAIEEKKEGESNHPGVADQTEKTQERVEDESNKKATVEEEGGADKKCNTVSAGSAANTGEDPELLALVSDEEEGARPTEAVLPESHEKDRKQKGNQENVAKTSEEKNQKVKDATQSKEGEEKKIMEKDVSKIEEGKVQETAEEKSKPPEDGKTPVVTAEQKEYIEQVDKKKAEETQKVTGDVEAHADQGSSAPEKDKENHKDKDDNDVTVVVTGVEGAAQNETGDKVVKDAVVKEVPQGSSSNKDSLSANVGPDATYKGRPITADSLAKSMAKDKGIKHGPDQAVVALNNTISREASRLGTSDHKQDKKVTIAEVEENTEENKEKEKEKVKAPESPVEPRGKDPVTDKLEDDLKLMAQDFNEKEFDAVIKRGGEIMKTLKRAKNIDAWSKRRLRNFAKVHSYLGSANSEKQNFDKARQHHNADLKIGEAMNETDIQSRALEHLGRTFIFENKLEKALEYFAKRAHLPRDTEATARLFHEIANCFFQLKAYEFAKDAAMVSLKAANEGGHTLFQLQSSVLIAVMKVKLNRVDTAFETFEEAMKYAVIRDDQEAAEAIRGAMRQIEDRVAAKVRDKWLAKIGKKPANAQSESGTSGKEKEAVTDDKQKKQQPPSVSGIIKSMEEEDQTDIGKGQASEADVTASDATPAHGKKDGSDTHRSEFLDAPDGGLEQKQSAGDRVVKIDLPEGERGVAFGKKKVPKKKTTNAAKANGTKKPSGKDSPPKNATEQAVGIYSVQKAGSKDNPPQKTSSKETAKAPDKNKVNEKGNANAELSNDKTVELKETAADNAEPDSNGKDVENGNVINNAETDKEMEKNTEHMEKSQTGDTENTAKEINRQEKMTSGQDKSEDADIKAQPLAKPKKPQGVKPPPGFYDKTHEEEVAYRTKLRTSYVPPKPKVKTQPVMSVEEELIAKQAMIERRKSQRFIGLDPEKVAKAKSNPPKPAQEENQPPPRLKTERFVGLKIKQGGKSPRKEDKVDKSNEKSPNTSTSIDANQGSPVEINIKTSEEGKGEQGTSEDRQEALMVPSVELLTPLPRRNDSRTEVGDVEYDANMPSTPIMIMNEDMPMIRKDSVGSKQSRPATRLSLAEMVKDDTELTPKGASKAELTALNALVQDSIRQDRKTQRNGSPPKVVLRKPKPTFREKRLAEEKAAMERARRRRFLANQKASFILMLTSPYAEVPSLKNRRNSQWFPLLRRRTTMPNIVAENSGTVGDYRNNSRENDMSPQKHYDDGSGSPRKYVKQSEKDILPRIASKRDIPLAVLHGEEATAVEKHKLAIAAKEIRRQERDNRREERKKLQEAEKKRRQQEKEESELLKLTPRANYPNPYNKPPSLIPGLEHHYVPSPEDDDAERQWRREGERMLRREKLRVKREKEIQRLTKEEARKRKFGEQHKKTGLSPRDKESVEKEEYTPDSGQLDESPELTPDYMSDQDAATPLTPRPTDSHADNKIDEEDDKQDVVAEGADPPSADQSKETQEEEKDQNEKEADKKKNKKPSEKKKSKEKTEEAPSVDQPGESQPDDKHQEEKENVPDEKPEEEEGEKQVDEEFDGYNDDEEDKGDEIAIHIEREARQMKEDYNKGEIDAVIKRGQDLLKSLRKHTDIVSWSRRRLRWFGVAHSYMGSALADKGEHDKAKSHHQADFRIGEALGEHQMQARALEHLARISIAENQIPKALEYLAKRAHLPRDSETSARLFLDMGNCFLQMGAIEFARDAAFQGLAAAKEGRHGTYQLQSSLLIAVCQAKLRDFDDAKSSFESALSEARSLNDITTETAIHEAIEQLELKRASTVRDKWKGKKGGVEPTPITGAIPGDDEGETAETS
ncbi:hypothetical protein RRG08_047873 [Elysia crispata]|uniref:Outer dynein arm-docking complex subunit 4 n=1 Tax=Elysia crispata TaxID=231223 RepID=A0AAE1DJ13_9GAST|nr:hypothetical protein RRG08_047873 [Elysia crispata]